MRRLLLVLVLLSLPSMAAAQVNVKSPFKASFCWDGKDDAGTTITGTVQVLVKIDGTSQTLQALPAPSGTGCPTGTSLYTVSGYSASKGSHSATGAGVTVDGAGIDSDPFAFAVVGRPPSKFQQFQIVQ